MSSASFAEFEVEKCIAERVPTPDLSQVQRCSDARIARHSLQPQIRSVELPHCRSVRSTGRYSHREIANREHRSASGVLQILRRAGASGAKRACRASAIPRIHALNRIRPRRNWHEVTRPTCSKGACVEQRTREPVPRTGLLVLLKTFQRLGSFVTIQTASHKSRCVQPVCTACSRRYGGRLLAENLRDEQRKTTKYRPVSSRHLAHLFGTTSVASA